MNKKKIGLISIIALSFVIVGCSKNKDKETTKSSSSQTEQVSTTKEKATSSSTTTQTSETGSTTSSETIESTSTSEPVKPVEPTDLEKYNALTEQQKVLLIVSQFDQRATEVGMHVWYSFDNGALYSQVHSGAGVGHPVYQFTYDGTSVTANRAYVFAGMNIGLENVESFAGTLSKEDLYKKYLANQGIYDAALVNVETFEQGHMPTMTTATFSEAYSKIGQVPGQ